ncbi:MAG TPA: hypothetical protein VGG05_19100 [Pseudonocardiaceae bacterium]|jgi:hypothetical protein
MRTTESDIIEQIIDELVTGETGAETSRVVVRRIDAASLSLDYGHSGRFRLTAEKCAEDE